MIEIKKIMINTNLSCPHLPHSLIRAIRYGLVLSLWFLPIGEVRAQNSALQEAINVYQEADFSGAITRFTSLAENTSLDKDVRKQALQYLGRAYVAKHMETQARSTIKELLDLEPPLVELDPDIESPPLMQLYYDVRKDYEGSYAVEKADPGIKTLAIVDFTNNSITDKADLDPLSQGFASLMINQMNGATDLKVIERERLQWLLGELKLQREGGVVDQQTAVRVGKLLGAQSVLFGSFIKFKKDLQISARLVKVETGEILMTEQVKGKADNFFDLVEQLSLKVAKGINVSLAKNNIGGQNETKSLDAMLSYSEGLGLLERNDYRGAYDKFLEAVKFDPNYSRARLKAESIKPMLS